MKTLLLVTVLIYFANVHFDTVLALTCYACVAPIGNNNSCQVNVTNSTVTTATCQSGYTSCMTLVANNTVTRACSVNNVCQLYQNSTGFRSCSTCVTNLCNNQRASSATSVGVSAGLLVVLFGFVKMTAF